MTETTPIVSNNPRIQARYEELRAAGQSHKMADMLAHQRFSSLRTDSTFMEGRYSGNQFGDTPSGQMIGDFYRQKALAAGVNPHGKFYSSGLARFPGDPMAWIESRADVKRVAEANGMHVSGMVNYTPPEPDVPMALVDKPYEVADDIIDMEMEQRLKSDPDLANSKPEKIAEARHELKEVRSGRKK